MGTTSTVPAPVDILSFGSCRDRMEEPRHEGDTTSLARRLAHLLSTPADPAVAIPMDQAGEALCRTFQVRTVENGDLSPSGEEHDSRASPSSAAILDQLAVRRSTSRSLHRAGVPSILDSPATFSGSAIVGLESPNTTEKVKDEARKSCDEDVG